MPRPPPPLPGIPERCPTLFTPWAELALMMCGTELIGGDMVGADTPLDPLAMPPTGPGAPARRKREKCVLRFGATLVASSGTTSVVNAKGGIGRGNGGKLSGPWHPVASPKRSYHCRRVYKSKPAPLVPEPNPLRGPPK
uniref:Uncharacterized protein n=1 Tax=Neobodo designis TaxID=312471 RepID=A0A7S1W487_NEODS